MFFTLFARIYYFERSIFGFKRTLKFRVKMGNASSDSVGSKFLSLLDKEFNSFSSGAPSNIFAVSSSVTSSSLPVNLITSRLAGQCNWHFMQPIKALCAPGLIHFGNSPLISLYKERHLPASITKFSSVMQLVGQWLMQILQSLQQSIILISVQLSSN